MSALALATLDDVAAVCRTVPDADVARVTRLLELVSGLVVKDTGQVFAEVLDDEVTITPRNGVLRLPQRPVTSLTSVSSASSGTLLASQYTLDPDTGLLTLNYPLSWSALAPTDEPTRNPTGVIGTPGWPPVPVTVVYSHGYPAATVATDGYPEDLALVVAEKAAAKWLSGPREAEGIQSESIDGYSQSFVQRVGNTNAWSAEHKAVLDRYAGRSGLRSVRITT